MKLVLTGGGTGGHIYPAVSVGQALGRLNPEADLLFIGSSHGPEGKIAAEYGLDFCAIPSAPMSGTLSLRNLPAFSKLFFGIIRAHKILNRFKPDVVIGTGGYTCAAVLLAQKFRHGKLVIHEQNVVPGKTNRILSRWADIVCVSFEESIPRFRPGCKTKIINTGMPVRQEFSALPDKHSARLSLNLQEDLFTVLVVGGSQGARKLNEVALDMWPLLDDGFIQVLHQAGTRNVDQVKSKAIEMELPNRYHIEGYLDMPRALASADVVVSRSGASTLAEISAAGLPSILVPYPFAFADHQRLNAEVFKAKRAALMLLEHDLNAEDTARIIKKLQSKKMLIDSMSKRASAVFGSQVADKIANELINLAQAGKQR